MNAVMFIFILQNGELASRLKMGQAMIDLNLMNQGNLRTEQWQH